ncbi:hypothetical protein SAMN05421734_101377 [Pelagirhabdus alkalitolerans]|uniref:Uncharacterized protein n=1 Tax=Pelagirhabdus alkalitolerans TaxID=1612202 RepID=A0A1G6GQ00_9BACI|nr:AsnC family protein [Pelagirhabdus alkalitolerans]SDB84029.1 hypothetical protein SAMN05421734_101377 [Pelagirhabdus alkalitolerans]
MQRVKYEYLRKRAIRKQPADDQTLLRTYETFEAKLIEQAQSEQDLLDLMQRERPFLMAAKTLHLTESEVYKRMQRLEKVLNDTVHRDAKHLHWIDVSNSLPHQASHFTGDTKTFLLAMQSQTHLKTKKNQKGG